MLGWAHQLHCSGFIETGNYTTATPHALFAVNACALFTNFRIILHLSGSKLASIHAGFARRAFLRVNGGFETALSYPLIYLVLILQEHAPER